MTTTTSADAAMPSAPPPPLPDGPSTPATTVPEAPATTVPEALATTVPESTTTTTTPGTVVDSGGGTGGGSGAVSRDQFIMAMPPDDAVLGESAATSESPSAAADLSGWLASMLDVVLPPVVVAVVLSPLIVIEVIGRAVVRSGSAILPPMVLLGLSLLFLHWSDRRRDAAQIPTDDRPRAAVT